MYPLAPAALIVTEDGFLLWSPWTGAPFIMLPLLAMAGAPTAGTAGGIAFLPFTGEIEVGLPCCTGAAPPTATGGVLDAIAGDWICFFVALAYVERAVDCAGTAARGDVVPETDEEAAVADCTALMGLEADEIVLVIRALVCGG